MKAFFLILLLFSPSLVAQNSESYFQCLTEIQRVIPVFKGAHRLNKNKKFRFMLDPRDLSFYVITDDKRAFKSVSIVSRLENNLRNFYLAAKFHDINFTIDGEDFYSTIYFSFSLLNELNPENTPLAKIHHILNKFEDANEIYIISDIKNEGSMYLSDASEVKLEEININQIHPYLLQASTIMALDQLPNILKIDYDLYREKPNEKEVPTAEKYKKLLKSCDSIVNDPGFYELLIPIFQNLNGTEKAFLTPPKRFSKEKRPNFVYNYLHGQSDEITRDFKTKNNSLSSEFQCLKDLKKLELPSSLGELSLALANSVDELPYIILNEPSSKTFYIFVSGIASFSFELDNRWGFDGGFQKNTYRRKLRNKSHNIGIDFDIKEKLKEITTSSNSSEQKTSITSTYHVISDLIANFDNYTYYEVEEKEMASFEASTRLQKLLKTYLLNLRAKSYRYPDTCEQFLN